MSKLVGFEANLPLEENHAIFCLLLGFARLDIKTKSLRKSILYVAKEDR